MRLETVEQYAILRWINQRGIAPMEIELAGANGLRLTMHDGSMALYTINGRGEVSSRELGPEC